MDDVPWLLVLGFVVGTLAFAIGAWFHMPGLMYFGSGGVMGLGWGVVESLEWVRRIQKKYKSKEAD